jgi:acyl-coenzyme A synthetase/AMP-(fatty) acid ligase
MELLHWTIARRPPEDPAIILDSTVISYGVLNASASGTAEWLRARGVDAGDVVAICASDAVLQVFLTLGLMQIGAVQATLDPRLHPTTFRNLLNQLGVKHLVSDVQQPSFAGVSGHAAPSPGSIRLRSQPVEPSRAIGVDDKVLLSHGSGTTGVPKIMGLRHKELLARCENTSPTSIIKQGERTFVLQRHTSPTYITRALQCLFHGGCLIEVSQMRQGATNYLELLCEALDRHKVDHVHCTAFHAKAIVDMMGTRTTGVRFPRLKSFLVGASPVSKLLRDLIVERLTPNIFINYGTNETGSITRATPELLKRYPESVGTASPLTEVAVLGHQGSVLEHDKEGMIVVRGPCVIKRYEGNEQATAKAFRDGWFHTGDMGYVTQDGAVHLLGRADDMMIIDGTNIYPAEIERVIDLMPEVKESAAVGVYSDLGRDHIVAFVVLRAPCNEARIIQRCRQVQGWKSPHRVVFVKSLPRNFAGKVLRRELVKLAGARKSP